MNELWILAGTCQCEGGATDVGDGWVDWSAVVRGKSGVWTGGDGHGGACIRLSLQ